MLNYNLIELQYNIICCCNVMSCVHTHKSQRLITYFIAEENCFKIVNSNSRIYSEKLGKMCKSVCIVYKFVETFNKINIRS